MKKELSFALNYALNKGFQIHPDAFKILDDITDVKQLEKIIKEVVKEKTRQKLFQINQNDLETYLGIKDDPNLLNEIKNFLLIKKFLRFCKSTYVRSCFFHFT